MSSNEECYFAKNAQNKKGYSKLEGFERPICCLEFPTEFLFSVNANLKS